MIKIKNLRNEDVVVTVFNYALPSESHQLAATEFIKLRKNEHFWATEHQAKFFLSDKKDSTGKIIAREINPTNFDVTVAHVQNAVKEFTVVIPAGSLMNAEFPLNHGLKNSAAMFQDELIKDKFTIDEASDGITKFTLKAEEVAGFSFKVDVLYNSL